MPSSLSSAKFIFPPTLPAVITFSMDTPIPHAGLFLLDFAPLPAPGCILSRSYSGPELSFFWHALGQRFVF